MAEPRPQLAKDRKVYVYFPGTAAVPDLAAPRVLNRPHSITADVEMREGDQGVLLSQGSGAAGYSLFVQHRRLHYVHNYVGVQEFHVESSEPVPSGRVELRFQFEPTGAPDIAHGRGTPGRGQLYFNGRLVGQGELPVTVPLMMSLGGGLTCGRGAIWSVSSMYQGPFPFTGRIHQVTVDVSGQLIEDKEKEMHVVLARE